MTVEHNMHDNVAIGSIPFYPLHLVFTGCFLRLNEILLPLHLQPCSQAASLALASPGAQDSFGCQKSLAQITVEKSRRIDADARSCVSYR